MPCAPSLVPHLGRQQQLGEAAERLQEENLELRANYRAQVDHTTQLKKEIAQLQEYANRVEETRYRQDQMEATIRFHEEEKARLVEERVEMARTLKLEKEEVEDKWQQEREEMVRTMKAEKIEIARSLQLERAQAEARWQMERNEVIRMEGLVGKIEKENDHLSCILEGVKNEERQLEYLMQMKEKMGDRDAKLKTQETAANTVSNKKVEPEPKNPDKKLKLVKISRVALEQLLTEKTNSLLENLHEDLQVILSENKLLQEKASGLQEQVNSLKKPRKPAADPSTPSTPAAPDSPRLLRLRKAMEENMKRPKAPKNEMCDDKSEKRSEKKFKIPRMTKSREAAEDEGKTEERRGKDVAVELHLSLRRGEGGGARLRWSGEGEVGRCRRIYSVQVGGGLVYILSSVQVRKKGKEEWRAVKQVVADCLPMETLLEGVREKARVRVATVVGDAVCQSNTVTVKRIKK